MCVDPMGRPRAGGLRVSAILSSELNSLIEDGGPAWASECPVLGVKQTSYSGGCMSPCSHKRKFVVLTRRRFVIANSRPIPWQRFTPRLSVLTVPTAIGFGAK